MRIDREIPVHAGQSFQIDRFRPEDAAGIANLFYSIYGPEYPFDTYYIPEAIIEENRNGNIHSVVARTPAGDIVAHGALYRSSPAYRDLYEIGQYIVLKNYRETFAAYKINQYIAETLLEHVRPAGIFGEAVCNHTTTQKSSARIGMKDTALEVDLMPAEAYVKEGSGSGRVSCLIQFRSICDRPHEVFIPGIYREGIEHILQDCGLSRTLSPAAASIPPEGTSELAAKHFRHAEVSRANAIRIGADFESLLSDFEKQAQEYSAVIRQIFLNLDTPQVGAAVDLLREKGYFVGGYAPRWFDSDGLLMQKVLSEPDFESICLYSPKAQEIKRFVQTDREATKQPGRKQREA